MRFLNGILQCVLVHILLIRPTDYSDAQIYKCIEDCGEFKKSWETCFTNKCTFQPDSCTYQCNLLDDFMDDIDDRGRGRPHRIALTCSKKGKWVPHRQLDVKCLRPGSVTMVKQEFHHMNRLFKLAINLLKSSYNFLGVSAYYQRADVDLPGFGRFMADRRRQYMCWARDVIQYVNKRGGEVKLFDIQATPMHPTTKPGLTGLRRAIGITKKINLELVSLRKKLFYKAGYPGRNQRLDPHLKYVLNEYLETSANNIYQAAKMIKTLLSFGGKDYLLGEYVLDRRLHDEYAEAENKTCNSYSDLVTFEES